MNTGSTGGGGASGSGGSAAGSGGSAAGSGGAAGATGGTAGTGGVVGPPCSSGSCIAKAETGWAGPVAVYLGPAAGAPSCGSSYGNGVYTLNTEPVAPAAECKGCSCAVSNVKCDLSVELSHGTTTCSGACGNDTLTVTNGACVPFASACDPIAFSVQNAKVSGSATCTPTAPTSKDKPQASWQKVLVACQGALGSDCSDGSQVCAPSLPPGLTELCTYQTGDVKCPAGAYQQRYVAYDGFTDTRDCSCSCGSPSMNCNGTAQLSTGNSATACNGPQDPWGTPKSVPFTACAAAGSGYSYGSIKYTASSPGATCAASSVPSGAATPKGPVTFCCL